MVTGRVGTSLDLLKAQYQEAKAPAKTISPKAETKNMDQNRANTLYICKETIKKVIKNFSNYKRYFKETT